ncbi:MAG: NAD(P)-dependent oxidoreductase [Candidatus Omnitrophica bacterium]|nr:NAD(P)-dependent oxidoreductase [Candidatus Omnitrophota bacterium]
MREVKPRVRPAMQSPAGRRRNFDELTSGYTLAQAVEEANRCILCKNPRCQSVCPMHNKIPDWMRELQQGRVAEAYGIIRQTSPMPELCSRLCPQDRLCEGACAIGVKHEAVAIGLLERFVSQEGWKQWTGNGDRAPQRTATARKRVAAVGSGPASLAVAQTLARAGHEVTVFERWPRLGGVLRWIPRFKLPTELLDAHLDMLRGLGVTFYTNTDVRWIESLVTDEGFDAAFIGIGASRPAMPDLPGNQLSGIMSSTEFLVRVFYDPNELPNDWEPISDLTGRRVAVLGGGDSAMDCVRTSLRLVAAEVSCVYRRDEANMPGSKREVAAAKDEGANFLMLTAPLAFHSEDGIHVSSIECARMELGAPDTSGRRSPKMVSGSNVTVPTDLAILAFGYDVEAAFDQEHPFLMVPPKGTVKAHPLTGATPIRGVFAGGDCVTGPNLVSTAARAGLTAAEGILRYFAGEPWETLLSG